MISDFELLKEAFSKKELCSRLSRTNNLMRQLESLDQKFHKVPETAGKILGPGDAETLSASYSELFRRSVVQKW